MDPVHPVHWSEQVRFPCAGGAAPDVHAAHSPFPAEYNGAARCVLQIGVMARLQSCHCGDGGIQGIPSVGAGSMKKVKPHRPDGALN